MSLMEDYQNNQEFFFGMAGCYAPYDVCAAFLLQEVRLYRNKNGGQNMVCTLRNCKGTIAGICFEYGGELDESSAGTPVMVQGRMGSYKGAPQIRIFDIRPLDADDTQNDIRTLLPHGLLSGEKENAHAMEGAMMIRQMAQKLGTPEDKAKKLANLVASHHTAYPFRVGVSPITPEAKLLAVVDNLDSSVSSNFGKGVVFLDGRPVHIQDVA